MRHFWGWNAVCLGIWETSAMTTHRIPTVSRSMWWLMRHHPLLARLLLGAWLAGVARHLTRPPA